MATTTKQEQWLNTAPGRSFNPDHHFQNQCVDAVDAYAEAIFGLPWQTCVGPVNGAKDLMTKAPPEYWTVIWNDGSADLIPQRGDVIVYDGWAANEYGHTAPVVSATRDHVELAQQDGFAPPLVFTDGGWYSNKPVHVVKYDYFLGGITRALGWLRPKLGPETGTTKAPVPRAVLNGIDISNWQAGIALTGVPADFVIIKATGGWGDSGHFRSPELAGQYRAASAAGKLKGLYHFARDGWTNGTADAEADWFLNTTRDLWDGQTLPVLDWEGDNISDTAYAKRWLDRVTEALGVRPLIYMNLTAANTYNWSGVQAAGYQLWLAHYPSDDRQGYGPKHPRGSTRGWETVMWQYTQHGRLTGYGADPDLNIFYGSRADWLNLAAGKKAAPKVKPAPRTKPARGNTYRVKAGDALSHIAARYGTTIEAIAAANNIGNADHIKTGQELIIPLASPPRGAPAARIYTVRDGDTLEGIAARFSTTWQALQRLNRVPNPNHIRPGQRLRLPQQGKQQ